MRQMVGLFRRGWTFYFRRTVPAHLRPVLQEIINSAGCSIFRNDVIVTLKGTQASREFWVSLRTSDEAEARRRALVLDAEAEALLQVAERRARPRSKSAARDIDEETVRHLAAVFRNRKLAADEALRRGDRPMTRQEHAALDCKLAAEEALARDMIARGDFSEIHFDADAIFTLLNAGIYIEYFSPADRRIHHAFNDAWLEAIEIIKERQSGTIRRSPQLPTIATQSIPPSQETSPLSAEALHEMWRISERPAVKTAEGFLRKLKSFEQFLSNRDRNFSTATAAEASLWKLYLLQQKSEDTVANYINAVKAITRWGYDNGHLQTNILATIRSYSKRGAKLKSKRRGFTDDEALKILTDARTRDGYRRWVPWLAHFTGARLSEICQLEKADIRTSESIAYISINQDSAPAIARGLATKDQAQKSLKSDNAKRDVPIHHALISEGFLKFVNARPGGPLFSEITPDRFGSRGGNATKVLGRWLRKDLKIVDQTVASSHSFRHRFITLCRNAKIDAELRNAMVGHSNNHISDQYGEKHLIEVLNNEINKIPTPIDLSKSKIA